VTRVALVVSRPAGGSDPAAIREVAATLGAIGHVEVLAPRSGADFDEEVGGAARRVDLLVVAGGDGTMNRALAAAAPCLDDLVLALVPMGTGNDLARTLELPLDARAAATAIVAAGVRSVDVGRASGSGADRLFLNACIGGFPIAVNEAIDADLKRRIGPAAFWVGGAKAALELERTDVRMNGVELSDCVAAGVGNGRTCGGGIPVWPSARPDDGLLAACALGASGHAAALALATRLRSGRHEELDSVATLRAERVRIESDPDMEINVDGELVGLHTPATFEVAGSVRLRA
jgi:diacylglycerol kinase (ATP)